MQKTVMETSTSSISEKARVIIYSRPGCHLCDEAKQVIESAQCANEYTLEEIDIESDVALLQRYRYDIPVITINGEEAFRHKVTALFRLFQDVVLVCLEYLAKHVAL
jgi:glutaredoxin